MFEYIMLVLKVNTTIEKQNNLKYA